MRAACILVCFVVAFSSALFAEEPKAATPPVLKAGVFVDTYYSSSAWRPASRDRQYLTQIARDREFNINLAHLEASVDDKRLPTLTI